MSLFSLRTPDENEWTCEHCGIQHTHRRDLEDIRVFDFIPDSFIRNMDWNPECNCGKYEALQAHESGQITIPSSHLDGFTLAAVPDNIKQQI